MKLTRSLLSVLPLISSSTAPAGPDPSVALQSPSSFDNTPLKDVEPGTHVRYRKFRLTFGKLRDQPPYVQEHRVFIQNMPFDHYHYVTSDNKTHARLGVDSPARRFGWKEFYKLDEVPSWDHRFIGVFADIVQDGNETAWDLPTTGAVYRGSEKWRPGDELQEMFMKDSDNRRIGNHRPPYSVRLGSLKHHEIKGRVKNTFLSPWIQYFPWPMRAVWDWRVTRFRLKDDEDYEAKAPYGEFVHGEFSWKKDRAGHLFLGHWVQDERSSDPEKPHSSELIYKTVKDSKSIADCVELLNRIAALAFPAEYEREYSVTPYKDGCEGHVTFSNLKRIRNDKRPRRSDAEASFKIRPINGGKSKVIDLKVENIPEVGTNQVMESEIIISAQWNISPDTMVSSTFKAFPWLDGYLKIEDIFPQSEDTQNHSKRSFIVRPDSPRHFETQWSICKAADTMDAFEYELYFGPVPAASEHSPMYTKNGRAFPLCSNTTLELEFCEDEACYFPVRGDPEPKTGKPGNPTVALQSRLPTTSPTTTEFDADNDGLDPGITFLRQQAAATTTAPIERYTTTMPFEVFTQFVNSLDVPSNVTVVIEKVRETRMPIVDLSGLEIPDIFVEEVHIAKDVPQPSEVMWNTIYYVADQSVAPYLSYLESKTEADRPPTMSINSRPKMIPGVSTEPKTASTTIISETAKSTHSSSSPWPYPHKVTYASYPRIPSQTTHATIPTFPVFGSMPPIKRLSSTQYYYATSNSNLVKKGLESREVSILDDSKAGIESVGKGVLAPAKYVQVDYSGRNDENSEDVAESVMIRTSPAIGTSTPQKHRNYDGNWPAYVKKPTLEDYPWPWQYWTDKYFSRFGLKATRTPEPWTISHSFTPIPSPSSTSKEILLVSTFTPTTLIVDSATITSVAIEHDLNFPGEGFFYDYARSTPVWVQVQPTTPATTTTEPLSTTTITNKFTHKNSPPSWWTGDAYWIDRSGSSPVIVKGENEWHSVPATASAPSSTIDAEYIDRPSVVVNVDTALVWETITIWVTASKEASGPVSASSQLLEQDSLPTSIPVVSVEDATSFDNESESESSADTEDDVQNEDLTDSNDAEPEFEDQPELPRAEATAQDSSAEFNGEWTEREDDDDIVDADAPVESGAELGEQPNDTEASFEDQPQLPREEEVEQDSSPDALDGAIEPEHDEDQEEFEDSAVDVEGDTESGDKLADFEASFEDPPELPRQVEGDQDSSADALDEWSDIDEEDLEDAGFTKVEVFEDNADHVDSGTESDNEHDSAADALDAWTEPEEDDLEYAELSEDATESVGEPIEDEDQQDPSDNLADEWNELEEEETMFIESYVESDGESIKDEDQYDPSASTRDNWNDSDLEYAKSIEGAPIKDEEDEAFLDEISEPGQDLDDNSSLTASSTLISPSLITAPPTTATINHADIAKKLFSKLRKPLPFSRFSGFVFRNTKELVETYTQTLVQTRTLRHAKRSTDQVTHTTKYVVAQVTETVWINGKKRDLPSTTTLYLDQPAQASIMRKGKRSAAETTHTTKYVVADETVWIKRDLPSTGTWDLARPASETSAPIEKRAANHVVQEDVIEYVVVEIKTTVTPGILPMKRDLPTQTTDLEKREHTTPTEYVVADILTTVFQTPQVPKSITTTTTVVSTAAPNTSTQTHVITATNWWTGKMKKVGLGDNAPAVELGVDLFPWKSKPVVVADAKAMDPPASGIAPASGDKNERKKDANSLETEGDGGEYLPSDGGNYWWPSLDYLLFQPPMDDWKVKRDLTTAMDGMPRFQTGVKVAKILREMIVWW